MEQIKEISVIILTYYHEQFIEKALDSVFEQECIFEMEVIIADDNSKDNTLELVKKYQIHNNREIRIIRHNKNVGTCRNIYDAFLECHGRYIVIMAGDDVFCDKKKLEKQYMFLNSKSNIEFVAVATAIKHVYTDGEETGSTYPDMEYRGKEFSVDTFLSGINYPDQGLMLRNIFDKAEVRKQFELLYKFSKYIEDLTLNFFLYDYGKIYVLDEITYALSRRRKDEENQHNYNSIRNREEKIADHLALLNNLSKYYGNKYDFQKRYQPYVVETTALIVRHLRFSCFKYFKLIPLKYFLPSIIGYIKQHN